jgi:hypothetical protein
MTDRTIELDGRRGMAAQRATDLRRLRLEVEKDQASLRARQDELERFLLSAPADTWPDAVEKTRYLLGLFAKTSEGQDPRRVRLLEGLLADFERLLRRESSAGESPQPG